MKAMRVKVLAVVAFTALVAGIAVAQQAAPTVVKVTFRNGSTVQGELVQLTLGGASEAFLVGPSLVGQKLCIETPAGRVDVPADKLVELDIEWEAVQQGQAQLWRMKQVRAIYLDEQGQRQEVVGTLRGAEMPGSAVKLRVQGQEVVLSANLQDPTQPTNPDMLITKVEVVGAAPPEKPKAEEQKLAAKEEAKPAPEAAEAKKPKPAQMQARGAGAAALEITVICPHCGRPVRIVVVLKPEVVAVKMVGHGEQKAEAAEAEGGAAEQAEGAQGEAGEAAEAAGGQQPQGGK